MLPRLGRRPRRRQLPGQHRQLALALREAPGTLRCRGLGIRGFPGPCFKRLGQARDLRFRLLRRRRRRRRGCCLLGLALGTGRRFESGELGAEIQELG